mgnify:CR=1 FL=1
MKRTSLHLLFILLSINAVSAQDFTFGIKGGLNFNSIGELYHYGPRGGNGVIPSEDTYYTADKASSYHFGGYLKLNFDYFYFSPEVVYTSLTSNYELALETSEWTQSNIDIGLFFGYRVFGPVAVYLGPSISMINDRQLEGNEEKASTPWTYEKTNLGVGAGLTFQYNRFGIDARYVYGMTKVEHVEIDMVRAKYGTNRGAMLEYNPSQFIISATIDLFSFGGEKKKRRSNSNWNDHRNL